MLAPGKLYFPRFGYSPSTFPLCPLQLTKVKITPPPPKKKKKEQINSLKPGCREHSESEEISEHPPEPADAGQTGFDPVWDGKVVVPGDPS